MARLVLALALVCAPPVGAAAQSTSTELRVPDIFRAEGEPDATRTRPRRVRTRHASSLRVPTIFAQSEVVQAQALTAEELEQTIVALLVAALRDGWGTQVGDFTFSVQDLEQALVAHGAEGRLRDYWEAMGPVGQMAHITQRRRGPHPSPLRIPESFTRSSPPPGAGRALDAP